ncbi:ShlB/FhaC/HecB family hemolysin secretion/activation protein [Ramlibacter albus]|uniref:ShlB/FhaC/HecB family hemolysin secretion/activation protein n=1 Tax=Ramlibacter albus TaxID=2079448 RepID=A0A923MA84_9BURK|nr:ShlB/FhaC/HecB family hemolysin secretion/activation protein [Ramlibacter albus]MBC5765362.1 ShlB/FhaC/HecB family hemolysin secretion/activation protein [Ramlibacter albus]
MTQETAVARRARAPGGARMLAAWAALATVGAAHAQATAPAPQPAAQAPAPAMAAPAPQPKFSIRGFTVTGDNPLGDGETARILAPFLRTDATMETLQEATAALEKALRERGFGLHRVALPPQEVGETVTLNIVTFTISRVAIDRGEGATPIYDDENIRRTLPELQVGKTPNFKKLAVQTAIANENPNKQVQLGIREADEPDKIDSTISVKELKPWSFGASLSNAGSKSSGRDRLTLTGGHSNLWNRDHQFVAAYTTSLQRTSDVKQLGLSYKAPLYELGGVVGASYTRSDVVGNFGTFTSTGAGQTSGINYTHYLHPEGGRRSYVTVGLDDKLFNASKVNDQVVPGTLDRRSRPVSVGYTARTEGDTSSWGYNVDLAFNTGSGEHNDLASYRTEDTRVTTTHWKALRGGVNYSAPVFGEWLWSARGQFQYSPDALIAGEQFGLGGLGSVRGTTTDRPVSGDSGVSVTFELTTPEVATGLRFLGFIDAGWISNNDVVVSTDPTVATSLSKPSSDHLVSVGLGLRYFYGTAFSVSADYGRLLNSSRIPLSANSSSPQRGDHRFYISVSYRF